MASLMSDFRYKATPQTRQQHFIMMRGVDHSKNRVHNCGPFYINKPSGIPLYTYIFILQHNYSLVYFSDAALHQCMEVHLLPMSSAHEGASLWIILCHQRSLSVLGHSTDIPIFVCLEITTCKVSIWILLVEYMHWNGFLDSLHNSSKKVQRSQKR